MSAPASMLPQPNNPPEKYIEQVKDVLEQLYDFAYLQRHPLALAEEGVLRQSQPYRQPTRADEEYGQAVGKLAPQILQGGSDQLRSGDPVPG